MKSRLAALTGFLTFLIIMTGCAKKTTRDNVEKKLPTQKTEVVSNDKKEEIEKRYLNEGFISQNIFRVIILAPEEECQGGTTEIEYRARKRAEASLQKFLISKDRIVDQNTRASILNLVQNHGRLSAKDIHCRGNNVFYYDIEKPNLKRHLKRITKTRN